AEIAARQLHRRRRPANIDKRWQIAIGAAERVGNPTAEARMIEYAATVTGARLDNGRKVVPFMAPHRTYDGDVVDDAADVRKPIGHRNAGLAIARERPQARQHRPPNRRHVIAETDGVDERAGPFLVFGIKGIDMTDAAAHE